jgi:hypothetical protein
MSTIYSASRYYSYDDNDEMPVDGHHPSDDIVKETNSLLKCIKDINIQRIKDIKLHKSGKYLYSECEHESQFTIHYGIAVYFNKKKHDGVSRWLDIYDDYYDYDSSDDEKVINSDKGDYHSIDKDHVKNIKKCINNCIQSDKKKLNWVGNGKLDRIGNIDYEYINDLLEKQNNKCHLCNDKLITYLFVPYCCYKFSIDRIDNNKPHDRDNVKISCYFCNCKNHILYDKKIKTKCDNNKCFCNNKLFSNS